MAQRNTKVDMTGREYDQLGNAQMVEIWPDRQMIRYTNKNTP